MEAASITRKLYSTPWRSTTVPEHWEIVAACASERRKKRSVRTERVSGGRNSDPPPREI